MEIKKPSVRVHIIRNFKLADTIGGDPDGARFRNRENGSSNRATGPSKSATRESLIFDPSFPHRGSKGFDKEDSAEYTDPEET